MQDISVQKTPVDGFPPAEYILDELKSRGWSIDEFCVMTGFKHREARRILDGSERITPRRATYIGRAFGTSSQVWYRLQMAWDAYNEATT